MKKQWILLKIKLAVFFHYLPLLWKTPRSQRMGLKRFILLLKRLLLFLSKLKHNKFCEIGKTVRLDLYVPGFPSRAFYTACDKFTVFGEKLPCTGALISITSACAYRCEHCYQRLDKGNDVELPLLLDAVKRLQKNGVAFFNVEGGEPFLRFDRLKAVCDAIDDAAEIWVNSTGYGMTLEKLRQLNITAVMFSLHSADEAEYNKFMGHPDAWQYLQKGIELCHQAHIPVAFNTCLLKNAFYDGSFEGIMEMSRAKGAKIIQIIKPKPAGAWLEHSQEFFSPKDIDQMVKKVTRYNTLPKYKRYPAISAQVIEESPQMFGCTAGGTDRFYINAKGDVQPCEFLNISFGNIAEEPFEQIFNRMRSCFKTPGTCMLCEQSAAGIQRIYQEHQLKSLPLNKELSEQIYHNWDIGDETDLYKKMR